MIGDRGRPLRKSWAACGGMAAGCALALFTAVLLAGVSAVAEEAATPAPAEATAPPPVAAPNTSFRPGFIDAFGRWLEDGASKFKSGMRDVQQRFGSGRNSADASAKDATGSVLPVPKNPMVQGPERCA